MGSRYVPIEAAKASSSPPNSSSTAAHSSTSLAPKRRRTGVTLACDLCRRKKTRCEGGRPSCASCLRSGAACKYSPRGVGDAENDRDAFILRTLRVLPPGDASRLLDTLRTNEESISLSSSPSMSSILWSYLAPTRNKLELELMVRHPVSYPPLFPLETASLPLESLLRPTKITVIRKEIENASTKDLLTEVTTRYFPARPLVDERLRNVQISHWTNVRLSNDLAASIMSLYIETDYQNLPLFNLDLFLEDFLDNRPYFCSRLLVNALFGWACQAYAAIDPEAHALGRAFFAEAQDLLTDGPQLITLTTVSAMQFMCLAAVSNGQASLGLQYLRKGIGIGTSMGLFGRATERETASSWLGNQDAWRRSASYTAWGVHNWASLYSFRYRSTEILAPPMLPMPGTLEVGPPSERINSGGAAVHAQAFKACCELWLICYDVRQIHNRGDGRDVPTASHALAADIYKRLLIWANSLPLDLVRSDQCTHTVAMMHMYFHTIVVDMFREVSHKSNEPLDLGHFETKSIMPRAIYVASVNQLKRLLLAYRLTFQTAGLSMLPQTALVYVGNAVISEANDSDQMEWRFYLRVCLAAMEDLYGSYRESWSVTRGLLSMSLKRGAIGTEEARRIMQEMTELGQHHSNPSDIELTAMMDLELAATDPSAAQVSNLAAQFEELLLQSQKGERSEQAGTASEAG